MPGRRWWFGATLVGVAVGISGIPAGAQSPLPTVSVPSVTVPAVTVPSVTVPQVTVPPVTTPPVKTPPVKTPPVTTPPVKTPTVTTPPAKTPTVTTPAVKTPSVKTPAVTTPSVSSNTSPSSSTSSNAGRSTSSAGTTGSGATGTTSSSGTGASGATGSAPGATALGATTGGAIPKVVGPPKTRKRDRALRDAVLRFEGCLDSVPSSERRVLSLRAGVGAAQTRTRAQVAHITGLSTRRVARLERRGLKRLRGLGHSGNCSPAASTQSSGALAGTTAPALPEGSSSSVLGGRETPQQHSAASSAKKPTARQVAVDHPLIDLGSAPVDLAPLVVALGLGALLLAVLRETRRER
jgi:hypothetical protein